MSSPVSPIRLPNRPVEQLRREANDEAAACQRFERSPASAEAAPNQRTRDYFRRNPRDTFAIFTPLGTIGRAVATHLVGPSPQSQGSGMMGTLAQTTNMLCSKRIGYQYYSAAQQAVQRR
jgi:hypothetical protein